MSNFTLPDAYFKELETKLAAPVEPGHPDHDDNPTRLPNWFLKLPPGIPVPRTEIIRCDVSRDAMGAMDGDAEDIAKMKATAQKVIEAGDRLGWPCFLRTDITSHKHDWNETCFLAERNEARVIRNLCGIVEYAECGMAPYSKAVVVRELLPTIPAFFAFSGRMPVTRERRYFVADGRVVCHHPYWPEAALRGHVGIGHPWKKALAALNAEPEHEVAGLTAMSERVGAALPGAWSVDWLWTQRGWFLIDMATAGSSYHWPGCETR